MANDYKVLYRKYRPTSFDEIVGQKYSISMLKNAVMNDKISHAYIFTGPRGTGKTSTAKIFAKTINCEHPVDGLPCGECNSCLNINNNADIIEIDAASNNGVDEIRELINNVKIAPSFSKYKVYIIDEVHMLSQSAFNALLLTLEEPPSHIVFILATTNIENVPITILSRCQRYDFKKLNSDELFSHLKMVCEKENIQITDDAISEIVYLSEGGCRDALSILNQLSTSSANIDLDVVLNNYGSVSQVQIQNTVQYYLDNNYEEMKKVFENMQKSSIDYKVFLKKLIDVLFFEAIQCKSLRNNDMYLQIKETIFALNDLINKVNVQIDPFMLIFLELIRFMDVCENESVVKVSDDAFKADVIPAIKESNSLEETISSEVKNEFVVKQRESVSDFNQDSFQDYLNQLKEVRINNCFSKADKNLLIAYKTKWKEFNANISSIDEIKSIIIDADVVLASSAINIITNMQKSMVKLFNDELRKIEAKYYDIIGEPVKFIALSFEEWDFYKKEYIKKLKENYVYQMMEEPIFDTASSEVIQSNDSIPDADRELLNIFDKDKLEIK